MSDPTRNCYNCNASISVYASECGACNTSHDPQDRPAPTKTTPENLRSWLESIAMAAYIGPFEDNAIDLSIVEDLTDADLQSIGVNKLGDRKRILREITHLKGEQPSAAPVPLAPRAPVSSERRSSHPFGEIGLASPMGIGLMMILASLPLPLASMGVFSIKGYQVAELAKMFERYELVCVLVVMWLSAAWGLLRLNQRQNHRPSAYVASMTPLGVAGLLVFLGVVDSEPRNLGSLGRNLGSLGRTINETIFEMVKVFDIGAYMALFGAILVLVRLGRPMHGNYRDGVY